MISQIDLIQAITRHLDRQGVKDVLPRQFNAIVDAANLIVAEFDIGEQMAPPGCGISVWLRSDQTGLSSKFIAHQLTGLGRLEYAHPHDPSDFGRCLGLLEAAPELRPRIGEMATASKEWAALVGAWEELEALYREELPTGQAPKCYERMRELLSEANHAQEEARN